MIPIPSNEELRAFVEQNLPRQLLPAKEEEKPPRKHIGLAILSYDGKVYLRTMMSILMAIQQCAQKGWGFNILNRENYDPLTYNMNVFAAAWNRPGRSTALQFQPRQAQLGLRVTF